MAMCYCKTRLKSSRGKMAGMENRLLPARDRGCGERAIPLSDPENALWLGWFSGDLGGSRIADFEVLHSRGAFDHLRQHLQNILVLLAVVSLRVLFLIPKTDGDRLVAFRGDERDLILESLLLPEHGDNIVLERAGKFRRTIPLQLYGDVARIHINLLGCTVEREYCRGLLEEFQVTEESNPMPSFRLCCLSSGAFFLSMTSSLPDSQAQYQPYSEER